MKPPEPYPKIHTGYVDNRVLWCIDFGCLQHRYITTPEGEKVMEAELKKLCERIGLVLRGNDAR